MKTKIVDCTETGGNYNFEYLPKDHPWRIDPPEILNDTQARSKLFASMPQNGIGAEIGVEKGDMAQIILEHANPKKLYLIDPWDLCETSTEKWTHTANSRKKVEERYKDKPQVEIVQDFSIEASKKFDNHYFDWIHFDIGVESYKDHCRSLAHWLPKIKKGGYLTGDIFSLFGIHNPNVYGPVMEFIIYNVEKDTDLAKRVAHMREQHFNCPSRGQDVLNLEPLIQSGTAAPTRAVMTTNTVGLFSALNLDLTFCQRSQYQLASLLQGMVLKHIDYFPSTRAKGGSYSLKIGDWVDDLDYDYLIQRENSRPDGEILEKVFINFENNILFHSLNYLHKKLDKQ